jgi:hypothetical protein
MKYKRKITTRERWALAVLPTVAIAGIYFFSVMPASTADLDKARKRLLAASGPAPRLAPTVSTAKTTVADLKRRITDDLTQIPQLQQKLAFLHQTQLDEEGGDAAGVIQRVEESFARGLNPPVTPLISEPIVDSSAKGPQALVSALVVDSASDIGDGRQGPRVWHYVFDDTAERLQRAVQNMIEDKDNSTVVPLSMNFVYNPENGGQTRLLELWLLY